MMRDEFCHRAKQSLFGRGLKVGLPYTLLRVLAEGVDISNHPLDVARRFSAGRVIRNSSPWADFIPRDAGYRRIGQGELPGLDTLLAAARSITRRRLPHAPARPMPPSTFSQLMTREELERHPEILEIATSSPLVEAVAGYLGFLPRLYHIGLWLSRPLGGLIGSQYYHLDQPDTGMMSLFLNVSDVTPDTGPFIFYPKSATDEIRRETDYERRSYVDGSVQDMELGRLADEEVMRITRQEPLDLCGLSGSAAFVDTSVCMHAGSRCKTGDRVVFVLRYMPPHRGLFRHDPILSGEHPTADGYRRMVMGLA